MSSIVREYREHDFDQVLGISDSVYARRSGSFSLVSSLQDSRMFKKYVVANEKERVIGYGLIWEQITSPYLILKVEIVFHPDYEVAETIFDKVIHDIQIIGPYAIQARCHQPLYLTVNSEPPLTVVFCFRHRHLCRRSNNVAMVDGNKKMPASKNRLKISALLGTWLSGVTKISFHQTSRTIPYRVLNWTG